MKNYIYGLLGILILIVSWFIYQKFYAGPKEISGANAQAYSYGSTDMEHSSDGYSYTYDKASDDEKFGDFLKELGNADIE